MKRRKALKSLAWAALSTPVAAAAAHARPPQTSNKQGRMVSYLSQWHQLPDMVWTGADFWANQLQDWEIKEGRLRCRHTAPKRNIQLLTHPLKNDGNFLQSSIQLKMNSRNSKNEGVAGFYWGIMADSNDYRNICAHGNGIVAGVNQDGYLIFDDLISYNQIEPDMLSEGVDLKLFLNHGGNQVRAELSVWHRGQPMVTLQHHDISPDHLAGHIGLVADFKNKDSSRWSAEFAHWELRGDLLDHFPDRTYGPVYFAQHTVSDHQLHLTAQIAPLYPDIGRVELYVKTPGSDWQKTEEASIHPQARTASFKIKDWDASQPAEYRLSLPVKRLDDEIIDLPYHGAIPADPSEKDHITIIGLSGCLRSDSFHRHLQDSSGLENADIAAFYVDRWEWDEKSENSFSEEVKILNYLHHWTLFGWAQQEIFKQIPSVIIEAEKSTPLFKNDIEKEESDTSEKEKSNDSASSDTSDQELTEVIHHTQSSHMPGTKITGNKIPPPWIRWEYGGIDIGILIESRRNSEDQTDPDTTEIEKTIGEWTKDWENSEMKALLSPSVFRQVITPSPEKIRNEKEDETENHDPVSDPDHAEKSPAPNRPSISSDNKIISLLRKANIVHIAGKRNPPSVIQYGTKDHGDANFAFTIPALQMNPAHRWEPSSRHHRPILGRKFYTGDFEDKNGAKMTIFAVGNPLQAPDQENILVENTGYGIIHFNKKSQRIRFECHHLKIQPDQSRENPFDDWPFEIDPQDNFASRSSHFLPALTIDEAENPVIRITKKENDELVSIFRIRGASSPHIFRVEEPGQYLITVSTPDRAKEKSIECSTDMKVPIRLTF